MDGPRSQILEVHLSKSDSHFDPTAFESADNTQSSGTTASQSLAELEDQDERVALASQISRQTIPDSQEPSRQTWSTQGGCSGEPLRESAEAPGQVPGPSHPDVFEGDEGVQLESSPTRQEHHHSEPSNGPDIPSHQLGGQPESPSIDSQNFGLTTPGTKPQSNAEAEVEIEGESEVTAGNQHESLDQESQEAVRFDLGSTALAPAPVAERQKSPVFLTQPTGLAFDIPESSWFTQHDSCHSAVAATVSDKQHSATDRSATAGFPQSQDAQIPHINVFVSHVEAFTDSHETSHQHSPEKASGGASPERTNTDITPMDQGNEGALPPSTEERSSAVDELSQIFNLDNIADNTVAPDSSAHAEEGDAGADVSDDVDEGKRNDEQAAESLPAFNEPDAALSSHEPPSSAIESMHSIVDMAFATPDVPASGTIMPDNMHHEPPTIALSDITSQPGALPLLPSLMPEHDQSSEMFESSAIPMGQPPPDQESDDGASNDNHEDDGLQEPVSSRHIVTLPFQASLRPLYDDTLLESKREVTQFGAVFNSEVYTEPDQSLIEKIDHVFNQLHNICDYPPDAVGGTLEDLPSDQLIKYCCDSNPKFNFIYELLQGLTKDTRVLIVARSVELLRLLHRLTEVLEVECVWEENPTSQFTSSAARVELCLPDKAVNEQDFDVVVGYDYSFSSSSIAKKLDELESTLSTLVLVLVTTHSIEHIDMHVSDDLSPLERKNALMSGIVRSRQLVSDPDRGYPEPHEAASIFLDYLNGELDNVIWEPVPVPEDVLDVYMSSQARPQMPEVAPGTTPEPESRKRKLDDPDDEDAKRMRFHPLHHESTVQTNDAPLPDDVRALLDSIKPEEGKASSHMLVKVPLTALQALAEQQSDLKRQLIMVDTEPQYKNLISSMETRIKEYERTNKKVYATHRAALEDRIKFERDARKAEAALQSASQTASKDADKAQKRITELEETVARLTAGPEGSGEEETPLAKTEKLLQESQAKVQTLEKRLEYSQKDADYARNLYQDATTAAGQLRGENLEIQQQVTELQKKTEETLGSVRRMQADNATKQFMRQIRDLKTQIREREIELDCTKDELRLLKNGRRETRQVSVPRSPRMGMMSPRTGRAGTHGGGSTSRGTSPAPTSVAEGASTGVPGMQFMGQPPPNGRWNHLRD